MVALAALSVFVGLLIFTPTCLMIPDLFGAGGASRGRRRMTRALHRLCVRVAMLFISRTKSTIAFALLLIATSVAVVANSETETSFLRNFRPGSSIVVDYGNVEKNLGGAGVWDLVLDVPTVLSNGFLEKVQLLEADLIEQLGDQGLSKAISIADATEVLGRSRAGKWMPASMRIEAMRTRLPTFIGALISEPLAESPDRRKLRVMLRSPEGLRADRKRALIAGVNKIANEHVQRWDESRAKNDSSTADATQRQADKVLTTGYYVIMTRLVDQLVSDQWRCFAAAAGLIWILMSLATRSVRLATAALVPNLLPAFLVLGFVSLSGGRINMGAAMIAAVSIGLSIDGSVHLLTVYLRRRSLGRGVGTSAVSAAGNIGAPVLLATLALVAGFSVLSTSEFVPTATFGTLVAWTLVIGTMVNLSVLPALIRGIEPDSGRHDRGE
jgi:predicted RND superfamily exporter protein